jgi:hypothetical protein
MTADWILWHHWHDKLTKHCSGMIEWHLTMTVQWDDCILKIEWLSEAFVLGISIPSITWLSGKLWWAYKFWDFHGSDCSDCDLLDCDTVYNLDSCQHFAGTWYLNFEPLHNVSICLQYCIMSQPTRPQCEKWLAICVAPNTTAGLSYTMFNPGPLALSYNK